MCKKFFIMFVILFCFVLSGLAEKCFADLPANIKEAESGVTSLIVKGDYAEAQAQTQQLVAKFSQKSELPETLFWIARKFGYYDRYEEEKSIYQQIIQNYPNSYYASKAKLGISRIAVLSRIKSQDYAGAKAALDKLISDFSRHPDTPDTLCRIGQKYGWSERHEEEKNVYQQIIQNYPRSPFTNMARLSCAKANVQLLIMSQDYDAAKTALDKLTADFSQNPDLPQMLYWIAERYEWSGQFEQAKEIYRQIIQKYPDNTYANDSTIGIARADVTSLVLQNDENADKALDKLIVDFSKNSELPKATLMIGEQCYNKGLSMEKQGLVTEAAGDYEKAAKIWDKLIDNLPACSLTSEASCRAGDCYYYKVGKQQEAIRCFQKAVDNNPEYENAGHAQIMIGRCWEDLKNRGAVDNKEADEQINAAYKRVITNYPNSKAAEDAKQRLSDKSEKEN